MADEMQTNHGTTPAATTEAQRIVRQKAPQGWILRNERFLRTILLLAVYVFGAMCLVSIFALGAFAFISGVMAGIVVVSLVAVFVLLRLKRRPR